MKRNVKLVRDKKVNFSKGDTRADIAHRLNNARKYIHSNFDQRITIDDVAKEACISKHHFKRLFREAFDVSPHQYLTIIRIAHARNLLAKTDFSVNEICAAVGFQSASSFIRLFKTHHGVTPTKFRSHEG